MLVKSKKDCTQKKKLVENIELMSSYDNNDKIDFLWLENHKFKPWKQFFLEKKKLHTINNYFPTFIK